MQQQCTHIACKKIKECGVCLWLQLAPQVVECPTYQLLVYKIVAEQSIQVALALYTFALKYAKVFFAVALLKNTHPHSAKWSFLNEVGAL